MLFDELAVFHTLTTVTQTGFSQGVPSITNDDELAAQVAGFLQQFLEVFTELKGANFFVTGESVCPAFPCVTSHAHSDLPSMLATVSLAVDLALRCSHNADVPYIANYLFEHPKAVDLDLDSRDGGRYTG